MLRVLAPCIRSFIFGSMSFSARAQLENLVGAGRSIFMPPRAADMDSSKPLDPEPESSPATSSILTRLPFNSHLTRLPTKRAGNK
jgi:hypothetical protein